MYLWTRWTMKQCWGSRNGRAAGVLFLVGHSGGIWVLDGDILQRCLFSSFCSGWPCHLVRPLSTLDLSLLAWPTAEGWGPGPTGQLVPTLERGGGLVLGSLGTRREIVEAVGCLHVLLTFTLSIMPLGTLDRYLPPDRSTKVSH